MTDYYRCWCTNVDTWFKGWRAELLRARYPGRRAELMCARADAARRMPMPPAVQPQCKICCVALMGKSYDCCAGDRSADLASLELEEMCDSLARVDVFDAVYEY